MPTLIPAHLMDDALLADIAAAEPREDCFHLWWLGQSGFLLQWNGTHVLFDPYLSDSLTEKYAATDKPHVRLSERVIDPARLTMVDIVTSSHNHTDHLDAATLRPLLAARPGIPLVLPAANVDFARERLGPVDVEFVGLDAGKSAKLNGIEFTGVVAAHNEIARDAKDRCLYLGFKVAFGKFTLYHSGDTMWHRELVEALHERPLPDVMLLPVNGYDPARRVAGNLNGTEAAALAKVSLAGLAIPHHYDMFAFNTAPPDEFLAACNRLSQPAAVLRHGERLTFPLAPSYIPRRSLF